MQECLSVFQAHLGKRPSGAEVGVSGGHKDSE